MSVKSVIETAAQQGVTLYLNEQDQLAFKAHNTKLSNELRALIVENKADIVSYLLVEKRAKEAKAIIAVDAENPVLSYTQKRLWMIEQFDGASSKYNMSMALQMQGNLRLDCLQQALDFVVQRHRILRTSYHKAAEGECIAKVNPAQPVSIEQQNVDSVAAATQWITAQSDCIFELSSPCLLHAASAHISSTQHIVLLVVHHIAFDGWSVELLVKELMQAYASFYQNSAPDLPAPSVQYSDYAHWQQAWLQGERLDALTQFWKDTLQGMPAVHSLPLRDLARPAVQSYDGAAIYQSLPKQLLDDVKQLAKQQQVTVFMLMHSVFCAWAARLSVEGQAEGSEVFVGTPIANREQAETHDMLGFFANTLVLRMAVAGDTPFTDLLQQSKQVNLAAYEHQQMPFEKLVDELNPTRSLSYNALFQLMLSHQSNQKRRLSLPELSVEPLQLQSNKVKFDLNLVVAEEADQLLLSWEYASDIFSEAMIQQFSEQFASLLQQVVSQPTTKVADLSLLTQADQQRYQALNANQAENTQPTLWQQCFEQTVEQHADRVAVVDEQHSLTFSQLNQYANQLAHYLREQGISAGSRVGLSITRQVELIIGLIATLKAGAVYVPVDPAYPIARREYIIENAEISLLLGDQHTLAEYANSAQISQASSANSIHTRSIELAEFDSSFAAFARTNPSPNLDSAEAEAYVIYTSGSTGMPKGVAVPHRGILHLTQQLATLDVNHLPAQCDASEPGFWGWVASYAFDASLQAICRLFTGQPLWIIQPDERMNIAAMRAGLTRHNVSVLDCTPTLLEFWVSSGLLPELPHLIIGGEAISTDLWKTLNQWQADTKRQAWNMYGPTECSVNSVWTQIKGDLAVIGQPLPNMQALVLDEQQQLCPLGVPGELYLSGLGVALGYVNNAEMANDRFLTLPHLASDATNMIKGTANSAASTRYYRTGDKVCLLETGDLAFVGRVDDQVKIRGHRIELGEVENQVSRLADVAAAAVVVADDSVTGKQLVAYVQAEVADTDAAQQQWQSELSAVLPEYQVPSAFVVMQTLPLTVNGKVDKKALPAFDASQLSKSYVAPETQRQQQWCDLFSDVLAVEQVGIYDNFFALGGHSLLVMRLIAAANEQQLRISAAQIIASPTPASLAALCELKGESKSESQRDTEKSDLGDGESESEWRAPANLIPANLAANGGAITPDMLPLASLTQADIDSIVKATQGGVANIQDIYSLAPLQQGILFQHMMQEDYDPYVMPVLFKVDSATRLTQLIAALQTCVARHDVLRTAFHWQGLSQPVQVVQREAKLSVTHVAASEWANAASLEAYMRELSAPEKQKMSLQHAPLLEVVAVSDEQNQEFYALIKLHHIVSDHVGLELLQQEVGQQLAADNAELAAASQYRDFVAYTLAHQQDDAAQVFFTAQLAGFTTPTAPFGVQFNGKDTLDIHEQTQALPAALAAQIRELCKQLAITPAAVFHAAWGLLLSSYSGQNEVLFGTVVSGRVSASAIVPSNGLGMYINSLPLRFTAQAQQSLREHLLTVHHNLGALIPFEQASLPAIQQCSELDSEMPLFSALLNVRHSPAEDDNAVDVGLTAIAGQERTNYPFNLNVDDEGVGFSLNLQAIASCDPQRMLNDMLAVLSAISANLEAPLASVTLLNTALSISNNAQDSDYPTLNERFGQQVQHFPANIAVVQNDHQLSYQQLDDQANTFAAYLEQQGVQQGDRVALLLPRSIEQIVTLLAVVKLGAIYVPIDAGYPDDRIAYLLADSTPKLVVIADALEARLQRIINTDVAQSTNTQLALVTLSALCSAPEAPEVFEVLDATSDSAYIMYTSGSTGQPKGVVVAQSGIMRLVCSPNFMHLDENTRFLQAAPIAFDAATLELWGPLLNGGTCVLYPEDNVELQKLNACIGQHQVNSMWLTAGLFDAWSENLPQLPSLHTVLAGGDVLPPAAIYRVQNALPNVQVINGYGPTENTTFTCCYAIPPLSGNEESIAIGQCLSGSSVVVLNDALQPVAQGVVGELYTGGEGLAQGYWQQAELTEQAFIQHPQFGRLYRTGDLVQMDAQQIVHFVGRADQQVKIRGFRIELSEIEAAISQNNAIQRCVVLARAGAGSQKQLVAYVESNQAQSSDILDAVKHALATQLPDYMQPVAWVWVDQWPLTPNGKVDKKALPAPDLVQSAAGANGEAAARVAPSNATEQLLVTLWAELLSVNPEQISCDANFFSLGGDSILAIQLVSRASRENLFFSVKQLFEHATIAQLAKVATSEQQQSISQAAETGDMPLMPIQAQFLAAQSAGTLATNHFNQSVLLRPTQRFNAEWLAPLATALIARHDALRLRFTQDTQSRAWRAEYVESAAELMELVAVVSLGDAAISTVEAQAQHIQTSLEVSEGPLWRLVLLENNAGEQRLLWVIHHLVVDGVSWRILLQDAETALQQLAAQDSVTRDSTVQLAPKTHSYKAWSQWLQRYAQSSVLQNEKAYWQSLPWAVLQPLPVTGDSDDQRSALQRVGEIDFVLSEPHTQQLLQQAGKAYRTQINELLLSALYVALKTWQPAQQAMHVDLEAHGREAISFDAQYPAPNISETVGWFTSIYPLVFASADSSSVCNKEESSSACNNDENPIAEVICALKEHYRAIPHQGVGFELIKSIGNDEWFRKLPKAPIGFNYLGQFDQVINDDRLLAAAEESAGNDSDESHGLSHPLFVSALVQQGEMRFSVKFDHAVHSHAAISEFSKLFSDALQQVIAHCVTATPRLTVSDCPLAHLAPAELLRLQQSYDIQTIYPATAMQAGLLFHSDLDACAYVTQMQMRLLNLDLARFQHAWQQVVQRYDILRTAFVDTAAGLQQVVVNEAQVQWQVEDYRALNSEQQKHAVAALRQQLEAQGLARNTAPLMNFAVCQLNDKTCELIWSHHHALMDGWCLSLVFTDVLAFYAHDASKAPLVLDAAPQYGSYIGWLAQQNRDEAREFWQQRLASVTQGTQLPAPLFDIAPAGKQHLSLTAEQTTVLQRFAQTQQCTVSTLVQVAWGELLRRYTQQETVVFGTVVSGRPADLADVEQMVGLFINSVPVVYSAEQAQQSLSTGLQQAQQRHIQADQYSYLSLDEIQQLADVEQLFDSIVVFENYPVSEALTSQTNSEADENALQIADIDHFEGTNYGLSLVAHTGEQLELSLEWLADRFEQPLITQILPHLSQLLLQMTQVNAEQTSAQALTMLSDAQLHDLLITRNSPIARPEATTSRLIHERVSQQAEQFAHHKAVTFAEQTLDYASLNARANQLAHYLIAQGVGPDVLVAFALPRSLEMAVTVLAILKAGGAYVPVDPDYPQSRIDYLLADSQAHLLLTTAELAPRFEQAAKKVCVLADIAQQNFPTTNPVVEGLTPESLAYVIYTSGSTGQPKGVLQTHQNVCRLFDVTQPKFGFNADDVWTLFHSIAFDFSVWELWGALFYGGHVVIPDHETTRDFQQFVALCSKHKVSVLNQTPSAFNVFAQYVLQNNLELPALRYVVFGGEALQVDMLREWWQRYGDIQPQLVNMYGITETTVHVSYKALQQTDIAGSVIGERLADQCIYLLDERLQPVPFGCVGELYIGGAGLARGYLNKAELTDERFIPSAFAAVQNLPADQQRLYKTGDIGRYAPNGELIYLGRNDDQVKVRGFRIELGEIERQISQLDSVHASIVLVREKSGENQLIGFVEPASVDGVEPSTAETTDDVEARIAAQLRDKLPAHMVPAVLVIVEQWPMTTNGKVDRKQLLQNAPETALADYEAPTTATEQWLVTVWAELLQLAETDISRRANFFALGGSSLLSTRLLATLRERAGEALSLRAIFDARSLQELATHIDQLDSSTAGVTALTHTEQPVELSFSQQRFWLEDQLQPGQITYHIPAVFSMQGQLDVAAMNRSLQQLVRRHLVLRTTYHAAANGAQPKVIPVPAQLLQQVDLRHISDPAAQQQEQARFISEFFATPFDLASDIMLRMALITLSDERHVVTFVVHHIATDGQSMPLLVKDFAAFYDNEVGGSQNRNSEERVNEKAQSQTSSEFAYHDFAVWQKQTLKQHEAQHSAFWQQYLSDAAALSPIPLDKPRVSVNDLANDATNTDDKNTPKTTGAVIVNQWSAETLQRIQASAEQHGVTLFVFMQTLYARFITQWSQQPKVVIGSPFAARGHEEFQQVVGCFLNTLPFCFDFSAIDAFDAQLQQAKQRVVDVFSHQNLPFERIVDGLTLERDGGYNPLIQLWFVLQEADEQALTMQGVEVEQLDFNAGIAQFDLGLSLTPSNTGLQLTWTYDSALFAEQSIASLAQSFGCFVSAMLDDESTWQQPRLVDSASDALSATTQPLSNDVTAALPAVLRQQGDTFTLADKYGNAAPLGAVSYLYSESKAPLAKVRVSELSESAIAKLQVLSVLPAVGNLASTESAEQTLASVNSSTLQIEAALQQLPAIAQAAVYAEVEQANQQVQITAFVQANAEYQHQTALSALQTAATHVIKQSTANLHSLTGYNAEINVVLVDQLAASSAELAQNPQSTALAEQFAAWQKQLPVTHSKFAVAALGQPAKATQISVTSAQLALAPVQQQMLQAATAEQLSAAFALTLAAENVEPSDIASDYQIVIGITQLTNSADHMPPVAAQLLCFTAKQEASTSQWQRFLSQTSLPQVFGLVAPLAHWQQNYVAKQSYVAEQSTVTAVAHGLFAVTDSTNAVQIAQVKQQHQQAIESGIAFAALALQRTAVGIDCHWQVIAGTQTEEALRAQLHTLSQRFVGNLSALVQALTPASTPMPLSALRSQLSQQQQAQTLDKLRAKKRSFKSFRNKERS